MAFSVLPTCPMCGADLEFAESADRVRCGSCRNEYALERGDNLVLRPIGRGASPAPNTTDASTGAAEITTRPAQPPAPKGPAKSNRKTILIIAGSSGLLLCLCMTALLVWGSQISSTPEYKAKMTTTALAEATGKVTLVATETAKPTETQQPTMQAAATISRAAKVVAPPQPPSAIAESTPTAVPVSAQVQTEALNVRKGPGTNYAILATLKKGDNVSVIGQNADGSWYQIYLADGREGWVSSNLVALTGQKTPQVEVLSPQTTARASAKATTVAAQAATVEAKATQIAANATATTWAKAAVQAATAEAKAARIAVNATATARAKATTVAAQAATAAAVAAASKEAGVTQWLTHEGGAIGVRQIAWSYESGYYRVESGKIFLSLYVIAVNKGQEEVSFNPSDLAVVDGGGQINGQVVIEPREPEFAYCSIKPGGRCEGWWTTFIWDRPDVKKNLVFRWSPCWVLCGPIETPIVQKK